MADTSAAGTAELSSALLGGLQAIGKQFTVVYADEVAASAGSSKSGGKAMSLQQACRQAQLSAPLLVVAPKAEDVGSPGIVRWGEGRRANLDHFMRLLFW